MNWRRGEGCQSPPQSVANWQKTAVAAALFGVAAAREIGNEIGRAFSALGETISDDDAKQDLKRAVSAIGDAVTVTVNEAGKAVRSRGAADEQPQRPDRDTDEGPPTTSG